MNDKNTIGIIADELSEDIEGIEEVKETATNSMVESQTLVNEFQLERPIGQVAIPALVCGFAGAFVACVLSFVKIFAPVIMKTQTIYSAAPYYLEAKETWHTSWSWGLALLLSLMVAYVILSSAEVWRRVLIWGVMMILVIGFSPVLMLYGILWVPIVEFTAMLLVGVFTLVYTSQYIMPVEVMNLYPRLTEE